MSGSWTSKFPQAFYCLEDRKMSDELCCRNTFGGRSPRKLQLNNRTFWNHPSLFGGRKWFQKHPPDFSPTKKNTCKHATKPGIWSIEAWKVLKFTSNLFNSPNKMRDHFFTPNEYHPKKNTHQKFSHSQFFLHRKKGVMFFQSYRLSPAFEVQNSDYPKISGFCLAHFIMPSCVRSRPNTGSWASFKCTSLRSAKRMDFCSAMGFFFANLLFGWMGRKENNSGE